MRIKMPAVRIAQGKDDFLQPKKKLNDQKLKSFISSAKAGNFIGGKVKFSDDFYGILSPVKYLNVFFPNFA